MPSSRRSLTSLVFVIEGILLLIVAGIHLVITPLLTDAILHRNLTTRAVRIVGPPFVLNHLVVGILLIPLGFVTILAAGGVRRGERWPGAVCLTIGLTILSLPVVLALVMRREYFRAVPFV